LLAKGFMIIFAWLTNYFVCQSRETKASLFAHAEFLKTVDKKSHACQALAFYRDEHNNRIKIGIWL
jgi:hypothetical protein